MSASRLRQARSGPDVDLIPVMNLFVVLIPFLLLSAAFYHVGVIPTSLPSEGGGAAGEEPGEQVVVSLRIEGDRLELSAHGEGSEEELEGLAAVLQRDGTELDQLGRALRAIKARYGASDTVIVVPSRTVPYQDVVAVLDAARSFTEGNSEKALFPVVVLSGRL